MKIAVLAWGSLVWDRGILTLADDFHPIGPRLPIEFCRISSGGRLTLVIDGAFGVNCITYSALSAHADLDSAIENLWRREGKDGEQLPKNVRNHGRVGFIDLVNAHQSGKATERHPKATATIADWARISGYDAVIWTALASNFHEPEKAGKPFSVDTAINYLEGLERTKLDGALNYIRKAPPEVQTLVRAAVNARWPEG